VDFSSNDYLGLARCPEQAELCRKRISSFMGSGFSERLLGSSDAPVLGATGSRLLSGDSRYFHWLERYLARVHGRESALLCNSGYDANLSVVSSLLCDAIVYDEYVHNSLHMGMRLWQSDSSLSSSRKNRRTTAFLHNSVRDLEEQLQRFMGGPVEIDSTPEREMSVVVLIESVYSMDGDVAPVQSILDVCAKYGALLVVDEAHGLGVFGSNRPGTKFYGTGVLAGVERHPALLCSVHTFGKAAGCHGAVICGSGTLKSFLINYGYPVIYSTALPLHSLVAIQCAYETMTSQKGEALRINLFHLIRQFRVLLQEKIGCVDPISSSSSTSELTNRRIYLLPSTTPIQALVIAGNHRCTEFCRRLLLRSKERILLYPIKSPTVPSGQERVRIVIHAHNKSSEVENLVSLICETLRAMGLLPKQRDDAVRPFLVQSKL
jgi:8-amino-7-oxononanoate synthase